MGHVSLDTGVSELVKDDNELPTNLCEKVNGHYKRSCVQVNCVNCRTKHLTDHIKLLFTGEIKTNKWIGQFWTRLNLGILI